MTFATIADYEAFVYSLRDTFPSILPPDIKHHRVPAPEMSFARPNLPVLIEGVEQLLKV